MGLFNGRSPMKPWFYPAFHVTVVVKAAMEHVSTSIYPIRLLSTMFHFISVIYHQRFITYKFKVLLEQFFFLSYSISVLRCYVLLLLLLNCNWLTHVDSCTHLHTNTTQNTADGTYITITKKKNWVVNWAIGKCGPCPVLCVQKSLVWKTK
jgi:hypothetical protein